MAKTKQQKHAALEVYKEKIANSKALIFLRPKGLTALETVELKKNLFDLKSDMNVVKNTLFKIALKESNLPEIADLDLGANAVIFVGDDVAAVAKLVKEISKPMEDRLQTGFGILEGSLLSKQQVVEIADMPSREVIMGQIAGILQSQMVGVANVLEDSMRSLVSILDQAFKEA